MIRYVRMKPWLHRLVPRARWPARQGAESEKLISRQSFASSSSEARLPAKWLGLLFAFALVLRLAHVFAMTQNPYFANPVVDAAEYDTIGWAVARGLGHPEGVFVHPPGYPYFLGAAWRLFGDSYLVPRLIQALLGAASVVMVAWLATRVFGRRVGVASGIAAAAYGMLIYFDGELLTPTLTIFLILASVACALVARETKRRRWLLAAGLCGGVAGTVTATALIVPLLLACFAKRRALYVVLATAVAIAPLTARNYVRGHELVLVSMNGGINFWIGNNPDYGKTVGIRPDIEWQRLTQEPARAGVHGKAAASRYFAGKVLRWAWSEPSAFLRLQAHKLRLLVSGNEIYRNHAIYPAREDSPVLAALLWKAPGLAFPFGLLMPLAALGLCIGSRRAPLFAAMTAGLALMVQAFFVTARYRVVLVPWLIIFAAAGVHWLLTSARGWRRISAAMGIAALFMVANVGQGPMDRQMNPDAQYSLGRRLGQRGHMKEAQALFESAVAARPSYVEAWLSLAVCYDSAGRSADAEAAVKQALLLDRSATAMLLQEFSQDGRPEVAQKLMEHVRAIAAASQGQPTAVGR